MSIVAQDRAAESIYFGLMTASTEESAEEARQALHSDAKEHTYTTIEGRIAPDGVETTGAHFLAPASFSGEQREDLTRLARQSLAQAHRTASPTGLPGEGARSFLGALAELLLDPASDQGSYTYSGRLYRLSISRSPDPRMSANLRAKGILSADREALRVVARLRREAGGKETEFRVWVEQGAARPLPLRVEYQPKPYLRLAFEAVMRG
jgi:hypothetical protein